MKAVLILLKTGEKRKRQFLELCSIFHGLKMQGFSVEAWYAAGPGEEVDECFGDHRIRMEKRTDTGSESMIRTLKGLYEARKPELLIFADDLESKDIYPRLAYRIQAEVISGCEEIRWMEEKQEFHLFRPIYGGNLIGQVSIKRTPLIAGMKENRIPPSQWENQWDGTSETISFEPVETEDVQILERAYEEKDIFSGADVILAMGQGLSGLKEAEQINRIAEQIRAEIGATRPMVQNGTAALERLIGATGSSVSPELLIAMGVSGSGPFLEGVKRAKRIVAVNNNEGAPILQNSDLTIVADCKKLIPVLEELLREKNGPLKRDGAWI